MQLVKNMLLGFRCNAWLLLEVLSPLAGHADDYSLMHSLNFCPCAFGFGKAHRFSMWRNPKFDRGRANSQFALVLKIEICWPKLESTHRKNNSSTHI